MSLSSRMAKGIRTGSPEEDDTGKNMCLTREHVCSMQSKALGMNEREGKLREICIKTSRGVKQKREEQKK